MELPELVPGEPGLAEAVLTSAAVARSTAREQLTIARCHLSAAEAAHAAAERRLDHVREVARLQRRFTEARERAEHLQQRAGAHREAEERMARGRKAETVAPALELREAADAEHRRAAAAEARARGLLPDGFADAGAAGLAAAGRRAAEELGGLEAARRAEQRLAALVTERADVDRQERDDREVLQEAENWLAGWETTRSDLLGRIESAQQAAARAEQLAMRREPALKRLDAARVRDGLTGETEQAQRRALDSAERAVQAKVHWLDLKEQRLNGIAAELAANLTDGEPCAVCGATPPPHARSPDTSAVRRRSAPWPPSRRPKNSAPRTNGASAASARHWPPPPPRPATHPPRTSPRRRRNWSAGSHRHAGTPPCCTPCRRSCAAPRRSASGGSRPAARPRSGRRPG
jgi:exonuclease SbcC